MNRTSLTLTLLLIILLLWSGCDRPRLTGIDLDKIDTSKDPVQSPIPFSEPIKIEFKGNRLVLTPLAKYRLSGVVVSKETYSSGWEGRISPFDLALAWGKLAEPECDRYMTYGQSNRWYFYKPKPGIPADRSYVASHSSNNHIIPANRNVYRAVKKIKKRNKVILEGFLVNMKGTLKGRTVTWNSSLSRKDTGNGSCELFYVTKVRIETHIFE